MDDCHSPSRLRYLEPDGNQLTKERYVPHRDGAEGASEAIDAKPRGVFRTRKLGGSEAQGAKCPTRSTMVSVWWRIARLGANATLNPRIVVEFRLHDNESHFPAKRSI